MTTYTAITNAEIDQDSPATEPLFAKLRDNPIAIVEGAAGAPRIQGAAFGELAAGDDVKVQSTSTPFRCVIVQPGVVRIKGSLSGSGSWIVLANGTSINAGSGTTINTDHTLTGPTVIEVQRSGFTSGTFQLCTSGAMIFPFGGDNIQLINGPT